MRATAKDLRFRSKHLLEAVDRGEEVLITYRGKPRAWLVPAASERRTPSHDTGLFGMWKDHEQVSDVDQFMDELRRPRF